MTAKLMVSGQRLRPSDLLFLGNKEWLLHEILKFYTHRQIEMYGLESEVCYFAIDNAGLVESYEIEENKFVTDDLVASPDKKFSRDFQYCVCAFLILIPGSHKGFHFVSIVSVTSLFVPNFNSFDIKSLSCLFEMLKVEQIR